MTDWLAVAISAGALALAGLSYRRDRRSSREAAASADRAAERAAEAVAAQQRMAAALEAQTPTVEVRWSLRPNGGSQYLLSNVGLAPAFDIVIDLAGMNAWGNNLTLDKLPAGGAHAFLAAPTYESANDDVTVMWADDPGAADRHTWTHPLPGV